MTRCTCSRKRSKMEEQIDKAAVYNSRAEVITEIMTSYSDQIEDYEKRNYSECMMCISFCAAILAAIGAFLMAAPSNNISVEETKLVIAFVIMLIPVAITIFLFNFAMNCRRSAVLRGYTQFLEQCLNKVLHETSMSYHGALFSNEIVSFPVNVFGPVAMGAALVGFFATCAVWSHKLYTQSQLIEIGFYFFYWAVLVICSICCTIFAVALMRNNQAVERSREACEMLYKDYLAQSSEADEYGLHKENMLQKGVRKILFFKRLWIAIRKKMHCQIAKFKIIWSRW